MMASVGLDSYVAGEHSQSECTSRGNMAFSNLALEIMQYHFCYILLIKEVKAIQVQGTPSFHGRMS